MTCSYCGSHNSDTEHRCRRCGRKPGDTLNQDFTLHRTSGALATQPRMAVMPTRPASDRPSMAPNLAGAVQPNLFTPNVIPMPRPVVPAGKPAPPPRTAVRPAKTAASAPPKPQNRRPRTPVEGQGELEFLAPVQPKPKTLGTTVEAMIFCEAPVASPVHRALAAVIDWTMVLIAYGLFLLTFALCGGEFLLTRSNLMIFGGAFAVVTLAYGLYWTVLRTETAGMRWTHLRVITFDGFPPETGQRVLRFAGSCLSLLSILGVFWSLADEESLGWQDHMSRTFPTPHELESRVFRRR